MDSGFGKQVAFCLVGVGRRVEGSVACRGAKSGQRIPQYSADLGRSSVPRAARSGRRAAGQPPSLVRVPASVCAPPLVGVLGIPKFS